MQGHLDRRKERKAETESLYGERERERVGNWKETEISEVMSWDCHVHMGRGWPVEN